MPKGTPNPKQLPLPGVKRRPLEYLRFEAHRRFHILLFVDGGQFPIVTWCGVRLDALGVQSWSYAPPAVCRGCRARMKHPYLLPEELVAEWLNLFAPQEQA
ncbi:MAG: hypothetical protein ABSF62_02490 [Bryobacteraceae bacterium]|jgi:hypothetical protein